VGLRDLFNAYRASRGMQGMDQETLSKLATMTPEAYQQSGDFNAAAHMERLAQAGLIAQPSLEPSDPRLEPIEGMPFDTYVKLVAASISEPTDEDGLEARGVAAGMAPGATRHAFELWGQKVVSDPELGVHYTAVLQAELATP
jgi:hypothetical protein